MSKIRIGIAQINPIVGDITTNKNKIIDIYNDAETNNSDILVFPELSLTGYPPEDLLLKPEFIKENINALNDIVNNSKDTVGIVGFADYDGVDIYNSAAVFQNKKIIYIYHKIYLPNYGVFDENRYFKPGKEYSVFTYNNIKIGVNICEDIWYPNGPGYHQSLTGNAQIIINMSSSPYEVEKENIREKMLSTRAGDYGVYLVYSNLTGGQDELVFDGNSMVFDPSGELVTELPAFEENLSFVDINVGEVFRKRLHDPKGRKNINNSENIQIKEYTATIKEHQKNYIKLSSDNNYKKPVDPLELPYRALVIGVGDYVRKNGFNKVLIGLSGGIDSSLTAAIAVDALGSENVVGISMPSRFTSSGTKSDAEKLANNLGIEFYEIPIENTFNTILNELTPFFKDKPWDITEENMQARIRGLILMSFSNKFNYMVLTTGNKSELSMGYCTIYGDMVGGFNVLKDVLKTKVFQLSEFVNKFHKKEIIPVSIIKRPPSAELRENQKDEDSLPKYEILDEILKLYVEKDKSFQEIIEYGFDKDVVIRIIKTVDRNEYKRRQGAPGIKITTRAFGKDRRMPITNKFID